MAKYRVELDRANCIAALGCVEEDPQNWKLNEKDNKIDLKDSNPNQNGIFTREIDEKDLQKFTRAAKACPVNVIHIYDEAGKQLI